MIFARLAASGPLFWFPLAKLLLHVASASGYGYFRDEFYYLACADRLAWGYVDHPPLSIAVLAVVETLFGSSSTRSGPFLRSLVLRRFCSSGS